MVCPKIHFGCLIKKGCVVSSNGVFVVIRFIILVKYTIGQIQMANSLLTENAIQSTVRTYNSVNRKVSQIGSDNMFDPMVHVTSRTT